MKSSAFNRKQKIINSYNNSKPRSRMTLPLLKNGRLRMNRLKKKRIKTLLILSTREALAITRLNLMN